ncbi:acyl-coenzyme A amino acid N-acyltransferase 1-like [Carcharodon carcharias]|uniref:acyl-coenzyme A amino acid N-acyltransferase 1-like n=1 Tax=Carcharodon carcharias TaxID=13397 RepID=UPI001B7ED510|nr:acyl-coenzyme A amino acid N-acyltransferase 1-like [Carcharodon carcharias]
MMPLPFGLMRAGRVAVRAGSWARASGGVSSGPVSLSVSPLKSLADEPLSIRVAGLGPLQAVTLRAQVLTERGNLFDSWGQYRADGDGRLDMSRSPSLGGGYRGVVPMGLLWTLSPSPMEQPYQQLRKDKLTRPMYVDLCVHSGHNGSVTIPGPLLVKQRIERWYSKPGVRHGRIREGNLRGSIFLPAGDGPFPGVIDLFGDDGGLTEFRACLLASRGFVALALPYFGFEDLPMILTDIHLEYFEEAVNYLQKHPKVKGPGIGVIGSSKGADLALSMVTFIPQVVASVCISGCNANTLSDLHYKDMHLPSLRYDVDRLIVLDSGILDVSETLNLNTKKDSIIPLEKAEGHILFVVGEDDKIWNSKLFAEEAIKRLKKHGKDNYELLSYPGAGHCIEPPCSPFRFAMIDRLFGLPVLLGGEAIKHCYAQQDSWQKIQDFLHLHLC